MKADKQVDPATAMPPSAMSAFSYVPPKRQYPKEISYYNYKKEPKEVFSYDRIFHQPKGYNQKLHRDDREHAKHEGLDIHKEESSKVVPTKVASIYGHNLDRAMDPNTREHVRIAHVENTFYSNKYIPDLAEKDLQLVRLEAKI
ncbi:cilia- and flagella-associated protein 90-like [Symsagittifera roscoffensis]|uniref:cilia- and flagella-associated protein 90-like n=1 Tax=Symsagittifera roscoffensis TaxID=84072 RepID=UPI00307C4F6D